MSKIRAKVVRPKGKGDFKKLRAKVGKKVARANVTKISVKSKQLQVPVQNIQNNLDQSQNDSTKLNELVRSFQHYNESSRKNALDELKQFLLSVNNAEIYIGQLFVNILHSYY